MIIWRILIHTLFQTYVESGKLCRFSAGGKMQRIAKIHPALKQGERIGDGKVVLSRYLGQPEHVF